MYAPNKCTLTNREIVTPRKETYERLLVGRMVLFHCTSTLRTARSSRRGVPHRIRDTSASAVALVAQVLQASGDDEVEEEEEEEEEEEGVYSKLTQ